MDYFITAVKNDLKQVKSSLTRALEAREEMSEDLKKLDERIETYKEYISQATSALSILKGEDELLSEEQDG